MADVQIVNSRVSAAPNDYVVKPSASFILKAVNATFTDNGATVDWLPCLTLISDSGHVVARAVDQGVKVTAGQAAEVSWFPGVKAKGAAAVGGAGAAWFYASRGANQLIPATANRLIGWPHHVTSDASVFTVTSGTTTDDTVNCLKAGIYIATADVFWTIPQTYARSVNIDTSFFNISAGVNSPLADSATDQTAVGNYYHVHDAAICLTQSVPGTIDLRAWNYTGSDHNVAAAYYAIVYLANSTLVT